jgi:hypothetical protein
MSGKLFALICVFLKHNDAECGGWQGRVGVGKESLIKAPIRIIFFGRCQKQSFASGPIGGIHGTYVSQILKPFAMRPPTKAM